jgi:hypothetical protein
MAYRIIIDLVIDDLKKAQELTELAKKLEAEAKIVNEGQDNEENSSIMLEEHYHDNIKPCTAVYAWSKKAGIITDKEA